jgi:hypothetical protein
MWRLRFLVAVMAACNVVWFAGAGRAQEQRIKQPASIPAEAKIRQALGDIASMEFIETPLVDVIEVLKHAHQIPIEIDAKALDNIGLSTDILVTRNLKGVTLGSALRIVLREMSLAYIIADEVLLITTQTEAAAHPAVRIYQAADVHPDAADPETLAELVRTTVARPQAAGASGPSVTAFKTLLVIRGTEEQLDEAETFLWRLSAALHGDAEQPAAGPPAAGTPPHAGPPAAGDPFGGAANPFGGRK